jgi:hypothetical protein
VILGWKNWLGDEYGVNGWDNRNYWKNLNNSLKISHGNEITLRFIYFLDYNQLKKGR